MKSSNPWAAAWLALALAGCGASIDPLEVFTTDVTPPAAPVLRAPPPPPLVLARPAPVALAEGQAAPQPLVCLDERGWNEWLLTLAEIRRWIAGAADRMTLDNDPDTDPRVEEPGDGDKPKETTP